MLQVVFTVNISLPILAELPELETSIDTVPVVEMEAVAANTLLKPKIDAIKAQTITPKNDFVLDMYDLYVYIDFNVGVLCLYNSITLLL